MRERERLGFALIDSAFIDIARLVISHMILFEMLREERFFKSFRPNTGFLFIKVLRTYIE